MAAFPTEFESIAAHSPTAQSPYTQEPTIPTRVDQVTMLLDQRDLHFQDLSVDLKEPPPPPDR